MRISTDRAYAVQQRKMPDVIHYHYYPSGNWADSCVSISFSPEEAVPVLSSFGTPLRFAPSWRRRRHVTHVPVRVHVEGARVLFAVFCLAPALKCSVALHSPSAAHCVSETRPMPGRMSAGLTSGSTSATA